MYKRIAVAVDGSDTSRGALSEAVKLAKTLGSTLLLLHVCEEMPVTLSADGLMTIPLPDMDQVFVEAGNRLLHKDKAFAEEAGINVETCLVEDYSGRIGGVISEEAGRWLADLLVLGTHGRKGLDRWLLGSVAEMVTRSASMPVLLVRSK
jgi:nucleotide-binding universal stress UspA family protein